MPIVLRWLVALLMPCLMLSPAHGARPSRPSSLPNVIVIVADDLGFGDLGAYGQTRIRTPNLDRMAAEGMRFTQAYAGNTVCAPSRCALITGRHTGHSRVRSNTQVALTAEDVTIAEVLRSAGYRTGAVGKWGLGWEGTTGHPNQQGFQEFFGYLDQLHAHDYYPQFLWRNSTPYFLRGNQKGRTDYSPALLLRTATNFVRLCEDFPFFLYFAPILPHANNERGLAGMEVPDLGPYAQENWPDPEKRKAAMITYLDDMVGKILSDLRKRRLEDQTLVLFTSDNGPHAESGVNPAFFRSSGPLRGMKRDLYEGGIRVPLIAWWPGKIKAGTTNDRPVAFWDFLPTLAEIAGVSVPQNLDGTSFAASLWGARPERPPGSFYWEFHERGYQQAARIRDWKGVKLGPDLPLELYDLKTDLGETNNIASVNPSVVREMEAWFAKAAQPWQPPLDRSTNAAGPPGRPIPENPMDRLKDIIGRTNVPAPVPRNGSEKQK